MFEIVGAKVSAVGAGGGGGGGGGTGVMGIAGGSVNVFVQSGDHNWRKLCFLQGDPATYPS